MGVVTKVVPYEHDQVVTDEETAKVSSKKQKLHTPPGDKVGKKKRHGSGVMMGCGLEVEI